MSFTEVFKQLKSILEPYGEQLECETNEPDQFYLHTSHIMKNKKPLFFAAVAIKKNYVSYHLMPVYVQPELLQNMSEPLKKRMQGKSCFNFKTIDQNLLEELKQLTQSGFEFYKSEGYI